MLEQLGNPPSLYAESTCSGKICICAYMGYLCPLTYNRYIHFFEGDIDDTLRQAVGA